MKTKLLSLALLIVLCGCSSIAAQEPTQVPADPPTAVPTMASLPNPASVFCEQQGGTSEIRTNSDGSQTGYCIFADGSECDEWAYYRGECSSSSQSTPIVTPEPAAQVDPGAAFCEMLGYAIVSKSAPDGSQLDVCQFPDGSSCNPTALLKGMCVPASQISGMANPAAGYCTSQGYTSEIRTAADGSQSGVCIFADSHECDEWAYYRGECDPATALKPSDTSQGSTSDPASPTPIPNAVAIEPSFYQGFWTYTHPVYGFSIMLPEDWVVDDTTTADPLMSDHELIFSQKPAPEGTPSIRMAFRVIGEDAPLWPTGVGSGEFVPGGTLDVAGAPVNRTYFVCPNGLVQSIWYQGGDNQPNIQRGNLEFSFIYSYPGGTCAGDQSLTGKVQLTGELIIASLTVP